MDLRVLAGALTLSNELVKNEKIKMKVVRLLTISFALLAMNFAVSAQETKTSENRDENGKFIRGPYLNNKFGDNWFVGVQGGVNIFMNQKVGYTGRAGAALDIYGGKWFMPDLGLRLGYQGLTGQMNGAKFAGTDEKLVEKFQFFYLHGDVMWNMSNTIGGYKESRLWNVIPYVHFGAMRIFDRENPAYPEGERLNVYDNEIAFGLGLYNTIRFTNRVFGTLDIRQTMLSPRFHSTAGGRDLGGICSDLSIKLGVGVYLGKVGWDRGYKENGAAALASLAAAEAALAAAKAANEDLAAKSNALEDKNKDLDNELSALNAKLDSLERAAIDKDKVYINDTTFVTLKLGTAPCTLFFAKNSYTLNATEMQHLDFYVKNIIQQDPDHAFHLTGTADSATGNKKINEMISRKRVEAVKKLIIQKYGISEDRLIIKDTKVSNKFSDPRLDRSVIIEH